MKLSLRVQPGASRTRLIGQLPGGEWKVAVTAPPEGGRANAAVVELMSAVLGVPKRNLAVTRGTSGRQKTIEVTGIDAGTAAARLAAAAAGVT
jgi:uncharacterized protein (TIGR00251 family)